MNALGGFNIILAILVYPIQQGFLQIHDIHVPSPEYPSKSYFRQLSRGNYGYPSFENGEPVLFDLYSSRGFSKAINAALVSTGPNDAQPNLWNQSNSSTSYSSGNGVSADIALGLQENLLNPVTSWYTIQNNTYNNGMYNSTGMRMNTSVLCNFVERSEYPAICAGSAPWSTSISLRSADDNMYTLYAQRYFNGLELKVCVPGDRFMYPWSVDTTTQTIEEELYFDISLNGSYFKTDSPYLQNYTQR